MHSWTDLQVDLSEIVAAHLVYMNLSFHGHSSNIQCDISILLKGIENRKSRVVATLSKPGHRAIACMEPPNKCPGTKLHQVEMISEEGINNTDLLEESRVNQLSTNYYTPLMGTKDLEDAIMSSF